MRHGCEICNANFAADIFAERNYHVRGSRFKFIGVKKLAQRYKRYALIRHFEPDKRFAGDGRLNADGVCGKRKRQIVLKGGYGRQFDAFGGLECVLCHGRTHINLSHFNGDAELLQCFLDDQPVIFYIAACRLK